MGFPAYFADAGAILTWVRVGFKLHRSVMARSVTRLFYCGKSGCSTCLEDAMQ